MRKVILISAVLAILLLAFVMPGAAAGNWADKADTAWYSPSAASFDISTAEELAGFAALVNEGTSFEGKTVNIAKDIDLSSMSWTSIGNSAHTPFKGTLDGQNHVISGLTSSGNGLIYFGDAVTIKNVFLKNAVITTDGATVGALIGYAGLSSTIENCSADGCTVTTTGTIGDVAVLAGYAKSLTMKNCQVSNSVVTVKAADYGAALVGYTDSECTITGCKVTGSTISAKGGGVGIVTGRAFDKITITGCDVASCSVISVEGNDAGGIIGFGGGEVFISDCRVKDSSVYAKKHSVGGISGYTYSVSITGCAVSNSRIESKVEEYVGGYAGSCVAPVTFSGENTLASSAVCAVYEAETDNVGVVIGRGNTAAGSSSVKVSRVLLCNKAGVTGLELAGFNQAGIAPGSDWKISSLSVDKIDGEEYGTTVIGTVISVNDYQAPQNAQPSGTAATSPLPLAGLLVGFGAAGFLLGRRA